jgi:hypothetical protein
MPIVCFDIKGTLLDHRTNEPIPSMGTLLRSLSRRTQVHVVSRHPEADARRLLTQGGCRSHHGPTSHPTRQRRQPDHP